MFIDYLRRIKGVFILSLLFWLGVSLVQAEEGIDSPIIVGQRTPLQKPLALFSGEGVDYFSGLYRVDIPILVPPARGGLVPDISLEYRSHGEGNPLGRGWQIRLDYIRRSLRFGVPKYQGPSGDSNEDLFEFRIGSHSGSLIFVKKDIVTGNFLYRPKREGLFAKFYYDRKSNAWIVYQKNGNVIKLGAKNAMDQGSVTKADGTRERRTFAWYVKTISDPDGNAILCEYDNKHYLIRITYDH